MPGRDVYNRVFQPLSTLLAALDILEEVKWNCPTDSKQYKQILEKERIYKFLLGLNTDLDEVRGRIMSTKPLPSVWEVFSEVRREQSRRKVMLGSPNTFLSAEGSALAARNQQPGNNQQKKGNRPWCEHCRRTGHTKETCWKIHGKPTDWKPRLQDKDSRGNIATVAAEAPVPNETSPFSKEQMEVL